MNNYTDEYCPVCYHETGKKILLLDDIDGRLVCKAFPKHYTGGNPKNTNEFLSGLPPKQ